MDRIETELLKTLTDELGRRPEIADPLSGLGIDSLRMAELAGELEERFEIRVDEELLDVDTVGELAQYVRTKVSNSTD